MPGFSADGGDILYECVIQCVCNVLQCDAVGCSVLQLLQCFIVRSSSPVRQRQEFQLMEVIFFASVFAVCCSGMQCVTACCSVL